jgi:hypothetical protein
MTTSRAKKPESNLARFLTARLGLFAALLRALGGTGAQLESQIAAGAATGAPWMYSTIFFHRPTLVRKEDAQVPRLRQMTMLSLTPLNRSDQGNRTCEPLGGENRCRGRWTQRFRIGLYLYP